ncbi:hypothetical protein PtrM4_112150 [Pyrenophora tritici-repentis]|uniref:HTH psq-type domain-containing protein n=1 Tax=Pyrenophora tritici-repentis TaxID=45151 RepID=A0A834RVX9_9PLEO|nr:hypothetical protein PtrM4_112150 [Pyrenophora tritici-repentis]
MDPIQEAIKYIESRKAGDKFSYRQVAKIFGVDRTTLSRRHRGAQRPRDTQAAEDRRNLNPQQEDELIGYIEGPTRDGDTSMDRERHLADNKRKYELYFNLLHSKMREHKIKERNTYNIDKKGFFISIAYRRKRIFSKAVYESRERTAAIRDSNREWVTLLACLSQGLHSLQVNNELLHLQNAELRAELDLIRSRLSKSTTLTTQEGDDWHGGAVFYSPRKLASVRARKAAELDEAAELQLQKARDRERKQQKQLTKSRIRQPQRRLDNKPK